MPKLSFYPSFQQSPQHPHVLITVLGDDPQPDDWEINVPD